ncbi:UNVERIFIED_CONTAM: hypothetical protein FKN15_013494, partial [Acipenser sinensis]
VQYMRDLYDYFFEDYVARVVPEYTFTDFKSHFRLTQGQVEDLIRDLHPFYINHQGTKWPFQNTVLACLWTLVNQESYRGVADRFNTSKSNICIHLHEHDNGNRAVDGCHIPIAKPQAIDNPESYYNRKHFYSVNLTAFCDNTAPFVHVNVGHPGSWHDARVYRMTEVARVLQEDSQSLLPDSMHIIGDAAYPLSPHLLTPFRDNGHLTQQQKRFNKKLSSARMVIERALGLLKNRFRILKGLHMHDIQNISTAVTACCVLHNICLETLEDLEFEEAVDDNVPEGVSDQPDVMQNDPSGIIKRNGIAASL